MISYKQNIINAKNIFIIAGIVLFFAGSLYPQNKMRAPVKNIPGSSMDTYGAGNNIFINFYQQHISPINGTNNCPMYPSCSQYSKLAFKKYAGVVAYIKSCERLMRCGQELNYYHTLNIGGRIKWYDPL